MYAFSIRKWRVLNTPLSCPCLPAPCSGHLRWVIFVCGPMLWGWEAATTRRAFLVATTDNQQKLRHAKQTELANTRGSQREPTLHCMATTKHRASISCPWSVELSFASGEIRPVCVETRWSLTAWSICCASSSRLQLLVSVFCPYSSGNGLEKTSV